MVRTEQPQGEAPMRGPFKVIRRALGLRAEQGSRQESARASRGPMNRLREALDRLAMEPDVAGISADATMYRQHVPVSHPEHDIDLPVTIPLAERERLERVLAEQNAVIIKSHPRTDSNDFA